MTRFILFALGFLVYMYLVTLPLAIILNDFIGPFLLSTFFVVTFVATPCYWIYLYKKSHRPWGVNRRLKRDYLQE